MVNERNMNKINNCNIIIIIMVNKKTMACKWLCLCGKVN